MNVQDSNTLETAILSNPKFTYVIYTDSVLTSQEKPYVSAAMPDRLMLFREKKSLYIIRIIRKM